MKHEIQNYVKQHQNAIKIMVDYLTSFAVKHNCFTKKDQNVSKWGVRDVFRVLRTVALCNIAKNYENFCGILQKK